MSEKLSYVGDQFMTFRSKEGYMHLKINLLLKFESTESIKKIIASDEDIQYELTKCRNPPFPIVFDELRKFMMTCTCDNDCLSRKFLDITGISLFNHRTWSECFAAKVFHYCTTELAHLIDHLFPDEGENYRYISRDL